MQLYLHSGTRRGSVGRMRQLSVLSFKAAIPEHGVGNSFLGLSEWESDLSLCCPGCNDKPPPTAAGAIGLSASRASTTYGIHQFVAIFGQQPRQSVRTQHPFWCFKAVKIGRCRPSRDGSAGASSSQNDQGRAERGAPQTTAGGGAFSAPMGFAVAPCLSLSKPSSTFHQWSLVFRCGQGALALEEAVLAARSSEVFTGQRRRRDCGDVLHNHHC
mmetsp:Transcript_4434/g.13195  ORF Transcript_4434/g.13195 Transcript_4434/m.13195 type:complete len:215 (+) Transcript_4434:5117-5761(+)